MGHNPSKLWPHATRRHPCPICGKGDWCQISPDGQLARCERIQDGSFKPQGTGWLHRLGPDTRVTPPAPRPVVPDFNATAHHRRCRQAISKACVSKLAQQLFLPQDALWGMGIGWDEQRHAFSFPMRNELADIIGIHLRSWDGRKWCVMGSRMGLFVPRSLQPYRFLLICEGVTDTAALLTFNLPAIGRPSCRGQEDMVRKYVIRRQWPAVIVMADNDEPKADGSRPGQEGAAALVDYLTRAGIRARLCIPPAKDMRKWRTSRIRRYDLVRWLFGGPSETGVHDPTVPRSAFNGGQNRGTPSAIRDSAPRQREGFTPPART